MSDIDIVLQFVNALNSKDINTIDNLMSDDFVFIDTYDDKVFSSTSMHKAWIDYFKWFPDYKIEVIDILESNNIISIFGYAGGSYKGSLLPQNIWRLPAAWKVKVENNKIKHWQVYADSKIPFESMIEV